MLRIKSVITIIADVFEKLCKKAVNDFRISHFYNVSVLVYTWESGSKKTLEIRTYSEQKKIK